MTRAPRRGQPGRMLAGSEVVVLFDVDNTLLDSDTVVRDLRNYLDVAVGPSCAALYWEIFEACRKEVGYADYLEALQRFRLAHQTKPEILSVSLYLTEYPFEDRLFPRCLDVLAAFDRVARTAILSDGDAVFQPRKVWRSGLQDAVGGRVLIYVHKELMLSHVEQRFPAAHYVVVDDKLRILTSIKETWKDRVTTVFVKQGHYALDAAETSRYPAADVSIGRIAELLEHDLEALVARGRVRPTRS